MLTWVLDKRVMIAIGVLLIAVAVWAAWDDIKSWRLRRATDKQVIENTEVLKQGVQVKQEVQTLKKQRDAAFKQANVEAAEKRRLLDKVAELEAKRAAVPAPKNLKEAADAIVAAGY